MDDTEFERTVEELYGTNKPVDLAERSTHLVELQAVRSGDGSGEGSGDRRSRAIDTQPRARPSMEARPRSRSRSRSSLPLPVGEGDREQAMLESQKGAKSRTREWVASHAQSSSSGDVAPPPSAYNPSRAHRPHRSEPNAPSLRPSDSQSHRQRASDAGRDRDGGLDDDDARAPPRLDIPSSLQPGARLSTGPAQVPFDLGPAQQAPSRSGSRDDHGEGQ